MQLSRISIFIMKKLKLFKNFAKVDTEPIVGSKLQNNESQNLK